MHLPTGTNSGTEFDSLYSAYFTAFSGGGTLGGSTTLSQAVSHNTALSTPLSGYLSNGSSRSHLGTYGNFWSSTWYSGNGMYYREVGANSVSSGTSRSSGKSIRCVLGGS